MKSFSKILESAPSPERRSGLSSADFVQNYSKPNKPVVITKSIEDWPAMQWTPQLFAREWGDRVFLIDGEEYTMAGHIDNVLASSEDNPAPYLKNVNVKSEFSELLSYIQPGLVYSTPNRLETKLVPQRIIKRGEGRYTQLFIGGSGRSFPRLHWDAPSFHTWSALLYGKKEWILFAPEDSENLYVSEGARDVSQVQNVYDVDLEKFPKFSSTKPYKVIQEPGEVVFVPAGWWHTAKNLEPSITIAWDQLCKTSWSGFTEDFIGQRPGRPIYSSMLRMYFQLVGLTLSASERIGIKSL